MFKDVHTKMYEPPKPNQYNIEGTTTIIDKGIVCKQMDLFSQREIGRM